MESQMSLIVWPCLTHLHKNIAQLITWSCLMIQSVSFTSAAFKYFAEGYLCFLASASAIRFLRILRKYVPKNKCFHLKKKSNVSFNEKVIFVFRMIFKLYFIMQQIIYCIIHRCLYSLFILLLFSYIIF